MNVCSNDIKTNEPTMINTNEIIMVKTENKSTNN